MNKLYVIIEGGSLVNIFLRKEDDDPANTETILLDRDNAEAGGVDELEAYDETVDKLNEEFASGKLVRLF